MCAHLLRVCPLLVSFPQPRTAWWLLPESLCQWIFFHLQKTHSNWIQPKAAQCSLIGQKIFRRSLVAQQVRVLASNLWHRFVAQV